MMRFVLSILVFITFVSVAQERAVLKSNGEFFKIKSNETDLRSFENSIFTKMNHPTIINPPINPEDTIKYFGPGADYRFNYKPGEIILQWFVAPVDMDIFGVGYTNDLVNLGSMIGVKIVKLNWDLEMLSESQYPNIYLGYYMGSGEHSITAFLDNLDRTGAWINAVGNASNSPFGEDLWSDDGEGVLAIPVHGENTWVDMSELGVIPSIKRGELFGVAIKNRSPIGNQLSIEAVSYYDYPGFKYFENGRNENDPASPGFDPGWWWLNYTFNIAVAVQYTGDSPPAIEDFTKLITTFSTEPRHVEATITDNNPSGGPTGIETVILKYSVNSGQYVDVDMIGSNDVYTAEIPGQSRGSEIEYYIVATDVLGNSTESPKTKYNIFASPKSVNTLLVFNGSDDEFLKENYFRKANDNCVWHDVWSYGPLTDELVENYMNIFEICTGSAHDYNNEVIEKWLAADGNRNYFLSGEDWLGAINGLVDRTYEPGSFEYDVLGVSASLNDITYDGTSGQEKSSLLLPIQNSLFGDDLFGALSNPDIDSLKYDPIGVLNTTSNWMDAFEVSTAIVDVLVETRGIAGAPFVELKPAAMHNITTNGNKVVFCSFDPLAISSSPEYFWFGDSTISIQYKAAEWFGIVTDVNEDEETLTLPTTYSLSQNYPNPFNPVTTIKYSIPRSEVGGQSTELVLLKIYDILGREVATLVNEQQKPGSYKVEWNAGNAPSGVYFYKLNVTLSLSKGEHFPDTKKLLLLK